LLKGKLLIVKIKISSPTKFNSKEDLEKYGVYLIELGGMKIKCQRN